VTVPPESWYELSDWVMFSCPVTELVRATASCVDAWPTNCSLTRYPASDPEATCHTPAKPEVVVPAGEGEAAAGAEGDGDANDSAGGLVRKPEKK